MKWFMVSLLCMEPGWPTALVWPVTAAAEANSLYIDDFFYVTRIVADPGPGPMPSWPLDPGWVKSQDPYPGWTTRIIFPRAFIKPFFGLKYLNSLTNPGSGMEKIRIREPGSSMEKSRIRNKHPGSATLVTRSLHMTYFSVQKWWWWPRS